MGMIDKNTVVDMINAMCEEGYCDALEIRDIIMFMPEIEAEPVKHGYWIECDYKHLEHGMIETEPNAGLCCSNCRTAFQKKKMTYKQYCAACGARMDARETCCCISDDEVKRGAYCANDKAAEAWNRRANDAE